MMRRMSGAEREEVLRDKNRKLYNDELRNYYSLQNIIRITKSRKIRW
jgi:hypothetical protein